jgi:hypothetical protein
MTACFGRKQSIFNDNNIDTHNPILNAIYKQDDVNVME